MIFFLQGVENTVISVLNAYNVETEVVSRFDYTEAKIAWADAIVTTGGDGTYLLAATKILDKKKPVIGFNSDPLRSKGHLCLPPKYSVDVKEAVDKLINVSSCLLSSEEGLDWAEQFWLGTF